MLKPFHHLQVKLYKQKHFSIRNEQKASRQLSSSKSIIEDKNKKDQELYFIRGLYNPLVARPAVNPGIEVRSHAR
jgi:hypothetical protein